MPVASFVILSLVIVVALLTIWSVSQTVREVSAEVSLATTNNKLNSNELNTYKGQLDKLKHDLAVENHAMDDRIAIIYDQLGSMKERLDIQDVRYGEIERQLVAYRPMFPPKVIIQYVRPQKKLNPAIEGVKQSKEQLESVVERSFKNVERQAKRRKSGGH